MFDTLDILQEFADVTAIVPGAQLWQEVCEAAYRKHLYNGRKRWQRWMLLTENQLKREAYLAEYARRESTRVKKAEYCRKRRAAMTPLESYRKNAKQRDYYAKRVAKLPAKWSRQRALSENQVENIRCLLASGMKGVDIAKQLGCSKQVISRIRCGKHYKT